MKTITKVRAAIVIGAAAAVAALGVMATAQGSPTATQRPTVEAHVSWEFHPANLAEARQRAEQIVHIQVMSVHAGPDIITPAPGEPGGVDRIPTQRVTVKVLRSFKGTARAGDQLTIFQTGGVVSTAKPGDDHPRTFIAGDPFYAAGEQHVLMLVPGPAGTLRIIAPEGRYRVGSGGKLTGTTHGPVADEVMAQGMRAFES